MKITIITNCTNRKRKFGKTLKINNLSDFLSLDQLLKHWTKSVEKATTKCAASSVYQGRTFTDATNATTLCSGDLYIVSAGMGYIHSNNQIPSYEFTVTNTNGSLRPWLAEKGVTVGQWWGALNRSWINQNPISKQVNDSAQDSVFLVALPSTYLELIADDLLNIHPSKVNRLRIFTSTLGANLLPINLKKQLMPYDQRLDSICSYKGTRGDFPQRALLHFVKKLNGHFFEATISTEMVRNVMIAGKTIQLPKRKKLDNSQISQIIESNWLSSGGRATQLLRVLRDKELVACEQSRFSSLWREVQTKMKNRVPNG